MWCIICYSSDVTQVMSFIALVLWKGSAWFCSLLWVVLDKIQLQDPNLSDFKPLLLNRVYCSCISHRSWFFYTSTAFNTVNNILLSILTRLELDMAMIPFIPGEILHLLPVEFLLVSLKAQCLCLFSFPSKLILLVMVIFT